jgi:glycerate 2-kinase
MRRAISARDQLRALFDAAVAAADPYTPTRDALLERLAQRNREGRGWIVAVGKASAGMAEAALAAAEQTGVPIAGGVVVGPDGANLAPPLEALIGDHPIPGARSFHAAMRIGSLANAVHQNEEVIVLISGGTSSLIAAPADDLPARAVSELFRSLLAAGGATDIHVMNAIRKRCPILFLRATYLHSSRDTDSSHASIPPSSIICMRSLPDAQPRRRNQAIRFLNA